MVERIFDHHASGIPCSPAAHKRRRTMAVEIGDLAPDFTLRSHLGDDVTLSQYRGQKHVVLSFHVSSFTGG